QSLAALPPPRRGAHRADGWDWVAVRWGPERGWGCVMTAAWGHDAGRCRNYGIDWGGLASYFSHTCAAACPGNKGAFLVRAVAAAILILARWHRRPFASRHG